MGFFEFLCGFATRAVSKMRVFSCRFKGCGSKLEFQCRKWGFARGRFINLLRNCELLWAEDVQLFGWKFLGDQQWRRKVCPWGAEWLCPMSGVALVPSSFLLPSPCSTNSTATGLNTTFTSIFKSKCVSIYLILSVPSFLLAATLWVLKAASVFSIPNCWETSVGDTSGLWLGKQGGSSRFRRVCVDKLSWRLPKSCTEGKSPCVVTPGWGWAPQRCLELSVPLCPCVKPNIVLLNTCTSDCF